MGLWRCGRTETARRGGTNIYCFMRFQFVLNIIFDLYVCFTFLFIKYRNVVTISSSYYSQLLCRAAFNAAYSHTGGQARELLRS